MQEEEVDRRKHEWVHGRRKGMSVEQEEREKQSGKIGGRRKRSKHRCMRARNTKMHEKEQGEEGVVRIWMQVKKE